MSVNPPLSMRERIIEAILEQLENIITLGTGRWRALCSRHANQHPNLKILPGKRGVLLECWKGYNLQRICKSLGFVVSDLFYDLRQSLKAKYPLHDWRRHPADLQFESDSKFLQANKILCLAKSMDITDCQMKTSLTRRSQNAQISDNLSESEQQFLDEIFRVRCHSQPEELTHAY